MVIKRSVVTYYPPMPAYDPPGRAIFPGDDMFHPGEVIYYPVAANGTVCMSSRTLCFWLGRDGDNELN